MKLIFLTKLFLSFYLLVVVGMLILATFAVVRGKIEPKRFDDVLGLIVMWPLTLMNEAVMRLRSIVTDIRRTSMLLNQSCEDRAKELRMYAVYIDSLANGLNIMETAE